MESLDEDAAPHVIEFELEIAADGEEDDGKCRVCLSSARRGSLFAADLSRKLAECLSVPVKMSDRLPDGICNECTHNLQVCHDFKTLAEKSYSNLMCEQIIQFNDSSARTSATPSFKNKNAIDVSNIQNLKDLNSFLSEPEKPFACSKIAEKVHETITSVENPHITVNNTVIKRASNGTVDDIAIDIDEDVSFSDDQSIAISNDDFGEGLSVTCIRVQKFENFVEKKMLIDKKEIKVISETEDDNANTIEIFTENDPTDTQQIKEIIDSSLLKDDYGNVEYYFDGSPCNYYTTTGNNTDVTVEVMDVPYVQSTPKKILYITDTVVKEKVRNLSVQHLPVKEKHVCPVCGILTHNIGIHMNKHDEKKSFTCAECDKSFNMKSTFEAHMKKHLHIKDNICEICGASYSFAKSLMRHKLIHTGDKKFSCDKCTMKFYIKSDLMRHLRVHAGYKPFVCPQCGMAFNAKHQLICHVRMHTGEKPYKCEICDLAFTYKAYLNKHCLKVHNLNLKFKSIHNINSEVLDQLYKDQNPTTETLVPKSRRKGIIKHSFEQFVRSKKMKIREESE